ncbi:hypothetical protein N0V95_006060 [Ascochyta clinopodiicola]|nr:hypothetical protein N0V95_006060 [Ascochyta clinopodiicola]
MASKKVTTAFSKYTVQPTGIYAAINRLFALDPKRSTGIPMNPQFRNPPPGGLDPATYDDPVTLPAADIAENPYWKRDVRRRYPRLSTVTQADAVALLEVGSAAAPKQELIGEAGSKQLVAAQEEGAKGLAVAFERNTGLAKDVLGPGGMPPLPSGLHVSDVGVKRYDLEKEQSYGTDYPCRTSAVPQDLGDSPLDFIYACSICCATFADVYEGHNETVKGFSDGINPKERLVTKLYLGSCCHVFCKEHIEGGGPPFHPAGQKPKAPCPVCVKEQGDDTARELYSIRGFQKDEYDSAIPPIWFKAPPINLGGNNKEMEALRLADAKQVLATMQSHITDEHSKAAVLQHENEQLRASAQQVKDTEALRTEVQRLRHLEEEVDQFNADLKAFRRLKADVHDLETFRKNKAAILQHLKLVPKLVEQNRRMKDRLASLGFAMPLEPVPNYSKLTADDLDEMESIAEVLPEVVF